MYKGTYTYVRIYVRRHTVLLQLVAGLKTIS